MDTAIIPAYEPDNKLIELVNDLLKSEIGNIIVIDDGSSENCKNIFDSIDNRAIILKHNKNLGKGAAIKTALRYIIDNNLETESVVTLDADGQHRPDDAKRLLKSSNENRGALILGVRNFTGDIPKRSMFGNTVTKYMFRLCSGKWVSDTQTGLRAFSRNMIPTMAEIEGERYEYEMNVLLLCAKDDNVDIIEVPIATIYHDSKNSCSHFRTIRDSIRIYGHLIAFAGSSALSFVVDYILFFPFVWMFGFIFPNGTALVCGNIAARIVSSGFNYYINSTFIFKQKENRGKSILQYFTLACLILVLNTLILYCLNDIIGIPKALAKAITELLLFIISFTVQKAIIFKKKTLRF